MLKSVKCLYPIWEMPSEFRNGIYIVGLHVHCESKKLGYFFAAYNLRNIEQIFTKLGINHVLFMLNIMP